jgi:hypothetical protein
MNTTETITASNSLVALTNYQSGTEHANYALITVESGSGRYLFTGVPPTATRGHSVVTGSMIKLETRDELRHFQFFGTAVLQVSYK